MLTRCCCACRLRWCPGHSAALVAAMIVTDSAMATHYARRAVVEVCGLGGLESLKVEPSDLLLLTKLVAASENECARAAGGMKV